LISGSENYTSTHQVMGKRQYDRQKHSTKAYDLSKGGKAGKGGWGGALDDYKHSEDHQGEEQHEETVEQTEGTDQKENMEEAGG
jgi:hypothetical protein